MRILIILAVLGVSTLAQAAHIVDKVVAIVNNDVITQQQVDGLLAGMGAAPQQPGAAGSLRSRVIERLIDERLLQQAMATEHVELTAEELQAAVNQFLAANHLDRSQLQSALASRGMSLDAFQQQMAGQMRQMKFIQSKLGNDIQINDNELRNFYQRRVGPQSKMPHAMTYHISEIVLARPARDPQSALKKAERLAKAARSGDFAKVAKSHSTSTTAAKGGDRGAVALTDLRPELSTAVQRLRVGQVTDPIVTDDGIVILKLNAARSPADDDFATRKSQIQQALFQDKMTDALEQYLGKLRAKAYIELRE